MATKTQETKQPENNLIETVTSIASRFVFDSFFGKINEELKVILGDIERKGYEIQERMLERLFSFFTLVLACIFIVLGIYSVLKDYLNLNDSEADLIVGAALLVAYLILNRKQKVSKETIED